MKATPPEIQHIIDEAERHHTHRCPHCSILWGCVKAECRDVFCRVCRPSIGASEQEPITS